MTDDSMLKSKQFVIPETVMPDAVEYRRLVHEFHDKVQEARQRLQQEEKTLQEHYNSQIKILWGRLTRAVDLDPEATWTNPEYSIEVRFANDGFAALMYDPSPARFQQAIADVASVPAPQDDDDEDLPRMH